MDICEKETFSSGEFDRHPWELARIKVVKNMLSTYATKEKPLHVLDLGCGDVFVAQELCRSYKNSSFYCVDIAFTETIIDEISQRIKEDPISLYSSLQQLHEEKQVKVDVVLLLDVIEHVEDDIAFLKELRESNIIDQQTKILITVPAYPSLFSSHDVYLKHYRRYTTKMLKKHLSEAGFTSVKSGYFFFSLLLIRILQKLFRSRQSTKTEKGIGAYVSKGKIDNLTIRILYLDFQIGKIVRFLHLPGLSCFSLCRTQQS